VDSPPPLAGTPPPYPIAQRWQRKDRSQGHRQGCNFDGADDEGGHDQHGVPGDRGVQADLGLAEPEAVVAELGIFFGRPKTLSRRWVSWRRG
jgi:hypothetical protein